MGLVYFFPGAAGYESGLADKLGLSTVFGKRSLSFTALDAGPDGQRGAAAAFDEADLLSRGPDFDWHKCGGFYIGRDLKRPAPGPADLVRERTHEGYLCELGDGNRWIVPIARFQSASYSLPKAIKLDEHGKRLHESLPVHRRLEAMALTAFDGFRNQLDGEGPEVKVDEEFVFDAAAEALGVNYHVGRWECSALGLLTTENIYRVLSLLCDWPGYKAMTDGLAASQKKSESAKNPDGSVTAPGGPA